MIDKLVLLQTCIDNNNVNAYTYVIFGLFRPSIEDRQRLFDVIKSHEELCLMKPIDTHILNMLVLFKLDYLDVYTEQEMLEQIANIENKKLRDLTLEEYSILTGYIGHIQ